MKSGGLPHNFVSFMFDAGSNGTFQFDADNLPNQIQRFTPRINVSRDGLDDLLIADPERNFRLGIFSEN